MYPDWLWKNMKQEKNPVFTFMQTTNVLLYFVALMQMQTATWQSGRDMTFDSISGYKSIFSIDYPMVLGRCPPPPKFLCYRIQIYFLAFHMKFNLSEVYTHHLQNRRKPIYWIVKAKRKNENIHKWKHKWKHFYFFGLFPPKAQSEDWSGLGDSSLLAHLNCIQWDNSGKFWHQNVLLVRSS